MAKGTKVAEEGGIVGKEAEDHIAEFDKRMDDLVRIAENAEFESGTLVGDIRDPLLDIIKNRPKPWSQMSESEQRDLVKALENVAKLFIRKVVLIVAEEDLPSVSATLKGYGVKGDTFSLKAEARGDEETALQLFKMDGHDVVIMSADAQRFIGQRKDAEVQPDAPALPFADGDSEEPPSLDPDGDEETDEKAEAEPGKDESEVVEA